MARTPPPNAALWSGSRAAVLRFAAGLFALFTSAAPLAQTAQLAQAAGSSAPPPVRWFDQRGQATELAVSGDGTAWALDSSGEVWNMPPASGEQAPSWSKIPGHFQRLRATFDGSVWGIGGDHRLYRFAGSVWRSVQDNVLDVAATPDGQLWLLRADGLIADPASGAVMRPPLHDAAPGNTIVDLVVDPHGLVWLLYDDGHLFRYTGRQWEALATPKERLLGLAVGFDGTTLGVGVSGGLWWRRPESGGWEPYPSEAGSALRRVALDLHGLPWGVTADGRILASSFADEAQRLPPPPAVFTRLLSWQAVGGLASDVSVGSDGSVYTLDADGVAWRFVRPDDTTILGGRFAAIVAGSDGLAWALDSEQNVYQLNGRTWSPLLARALALAVGQGNRLWGLPLSGGIALWNATQQAWQMMAQTPATPRALAVGRGDSLWIIDNQANVLMFSGGQWRALPGIQAVSLGADLGETVYASALDGSIYWLDPRELNWKPATGQAKRIAVGLGGAPWAIAPNNQLFATARFLQQAQARDDAAMAAANAARQPELSFLPLWPLPTLTGPLSYTLLTGPRQLRDIAIGANGPVFGVDSNGELLCFSNPDRQFKLVSPGESQRVGVDTTGTPWLVGRDGLVSHFAQGQWRVVPEFTGQDIAGGTDGNVWAVGTDGQSYLYNPGTDRFVLQPVLSSDRPFKASRIAGGNAAVSWVVSQDKQLFRCQQGACRLALLAATDVAVAPDNTPFVLDALGAVERYNLRSNAFDKQNGMGVALAVGPQGLPWLVQPSGQIETAGLILPQSHQVNTPSCAAPFAGAPTPLAPASAASLVATDDIANLPPGDSLNLLANDSFAGRAPTLAQVKLNFQPGNGGLLLNGASVYVPTSAVPGSLLTASYQICPSQVFGICASAAVRIEVASATGADTVPGAPTQVSAVAGNGAATVSFTPPANNGSSPIQSYTVTSSPGNIRVSGAASPLLLTGLINGQAYTFTVSATNGAGTGPASNPSAAVTPAAPATVPGAPTQVSAVAGNGQATVSFSVPASNGGSAILSYTVTSSPGNLKVSGITSPLTLTGLSNGQSYTFTVTATNAVGAGAASTPSNAVTPLAPATVPGAPTQVSAVAGNSQATVSFTAPASNGGSAIEGYTVTSSHGSIKVSGAASPLVLTGLSNGQAYTFTVTASNAVGTGPASAPSNAVTPAAPATLPGAPTQLSAVAGNAQATISFTAPASNGGSAILNYTVTSSPGNIKVSGTASPLTVTGLSNGQSYTFTVTATNAVGTGPASASSNAVTPATVPGAPTQVSAVTGNAQATISFTAPVSNGGSPILSYTVTSSPSNLKVSGATSPLTVTGLSNGQSYTFTVTATNEVGTGAASAASNAVTPAAPATVPEAPTQVSAVAGNGQATISFTAPASNGGSAILNYTVTSSPGNIKVSGTASPLTVTGLSNGQSYTFTVTATNAVGAGPASAASNAVTPAAPAAAPGAPTLVNAVAGNGQATISFTAPASNGGSAILSYAVTSSPGNIRVSGTASPLTVTGLSNGQSYTFTVTATNAVGTGPASAPSNAVTPATVPGAPTQVSAVAGNAQATISFTAPASNGGSAIQSYILTSSPGNLSASGSGSPLTVTGLTNGQSYTFTIVATNAVGTGPASTASNAVIPVTLPGAPTQVSAMAGNAQATISFTAPMSNGGSPIQSYKATSSPGNLSASGGGSPLMVTGLSNGRSYTFRVTATNAVGTGPASAASNAVTPAAPPQPPTQLSVQPGPGPGSAMVFFVAPTNNGGSAILSYTAISSPGGQNASGSASPLTINGLTAGTQYTITVTATNHAGTSAPSTPSAPFTPQ